MTFEAYAREWLERQNFIKSTRKWTRQGLEVYAFPVIGEKGDPGKVCVIDWN